MSFKEQVAADISAVFLNPDEFGETHNLQGVDCTCIIFGDETERRKPTGRRGNVHSTEGLHGDFVKICVRAGIIEEPEQGQNFKVDGKLFKVDTCTNDMGMLTIELGAYRMGGPF